MTYPPQTCYMATVERRKAVDKKKKLILTQIRNNGKSRIEKGIQFIKYERLLFKEYDEKKLHDTDGKLNYIEYIKDGKCIIFCEYLYDCYHNDEKVDMVTYMTWEGK